MYKGLDPENGEEVAIKLESARTKFPQLLHEVEVYSILKGGAGIANVRWSGPQGDFNAMVLDLLGESLEDLFCRCYRRFDLKTVLMVAEQVLERVEFLH